MDKITSTKSCALDMEYNRVENKEETLRQNMSNILQRNLNIKIRGNLTKDERRVLKVHNADLKISVYVCVHIKIIP